MHNSQIRLASRPSGLPGPENFVLCRAAYPELPTDGLIVRNHFLSVDPAMRGWICDMDNYLSPVAIDSVMRSLAVGEVVASSCDEYSPGELVTGWFGWQEYAAVTPENVIRKVQPSEGPMSASLGVLGLNGITACLALHTIGRPEKDDVVLVSTAAGAVGSIVGQLAKRAGCRVIGLTGSDAKVEQCMQHFGYDLAINYKTTGSLAETVSAWAGQGIDIFFDNTAGEIADCIIPLMNLGGRVIQCGTASVASWSPIPVAPRRERYILTKRLLHQGFVIFDHMDQWPAVIATLAELLRIGEISCQEDVREGLHRAPQALADLYLGANQGKTIIKLV